MSQMWYEDVAIISSNYTSFSSSFVSFCVPTLSLIFVSAIIVFKEKQKDLEWVFFD